MIDDADLSRLARFFAGECTPDEARATEAWLAADHSRMHDAERLREAWAASAIPETTPNSDAA